MLYKFKSEYITSELLKFKGDTKNQCGLISKLTGVRKENPLPDSDSDEALAEHFTSFFTSKIEKIRKDLDIFETYVPPFVEVPQVLDGLVG